MSSILATIARHSVRAAVIVPILALALLAALIGVRDTQAVHDLDFELDGNTAPDVADPAPYDWESLFDIAGDAVPTPKATLPGLFKTATFVRDFVAGETGPDLSTFATGSKDVLPISTGWECTGANKPSPPKDDILNAYAAVSANGDTILYFGFERFKNNGDADVGFWFLQDDVGCEALDPPGTGGGSTTSFTGDHMDGDLLLVSEFTKGGGDSAIIGYGWSGSAPGFLNTTPLFPAVDCVLTTGPDDICATANTSSFTPDWLTQSDENPSTLLDTSEFYEGGINLTALDREACFSTFMAVTRASQSLTAALHDFALGSLDLCDIEVEKSVTPDEICEGAATDVEYEITVRNTGAVTLTITLTDTVLDDTTVQNAFEAENGASDEMSPGDEVTFTVPDNISTGVTNTVTATGSLNGDSVSDTATATVTAFDCDIEVTKSVSPDEVCKGSNTAVTWTFRVWNAGTVNLTNVTFTDALLGNATVQAAFVAENGNTTLTTSQNAGNKVVFTVPDTISATTTNSVTVEGDALGLSPADSDTATATVTAFDCDIEVTKSVNPNQVCEGSDTAVTWTFRVWNAGSVNLTNVTFTDALLGNATVQAAFVAENGNTTLTTSQNAGNKVVFTVPDTISATTTNSVTVEGDALGLSPADSDTATATVTALPCEIHGHKFNDTENNGVGGVDLPLENWEIQLWSDPNGDGDPADGVKLETTFTDGAGEYWFMNLAPAKYVVLEVLQAGWAQTFPAAPGTISVTIAVGTVSNNNDFYNFQPPPGDTFPTQVDCPTFVAGTDPLNQINYSADGTINKNVNPGVFFYWSTFTTAGGALLIEQTENSTNGDHRFKVHKGWARLFDADCNFIKDLTVSGDGVTVTGTVGSGTFILGVKYDSKSIAGLTAPTPSTVTYDFTTKVGGTIVDQAADPKLQLVKS